MGQAENLIRLDHSFIEILLNISQKQKYFFKIGLVNMVGTKKYLQKIRMAQLSIAVSFMKNGASIEFDTFRAQFHRYTTEFFTKTKVFFQNRSR